jgi:hypothetical protein
MKKVRISKIGQVENALHESASFKDYEKGEYNPNVSLPIEYWLEGYLKQEPTIGKSVLVDRTSRNGIEVAGVFASSTVTELTDNGFKTLNSIYKLEYI